MTLELKRVPLDFNWPTRKPFEGEIPQGLGYQVWDKDAPAPISPITKTEDGIILWMMEQGYSRMNSIKLVREAQRLPQN